MLFMDKVNDVTVVAMKIIALLVLAAALLIFHLVPQYIETYKED